MIGRNISAVALTAVFNWVEYRLIVRVQHAVLLPSLFVVYANEKRCKLKDFAAK
jgi:hypothetical protein